LVVVPNLPSHLEFEWEEPRVRGFWEAVGQHHMVVRSDKHGCGLSDPNRMDFSLDPRRSGRRGYRKGNRAKVFCALGTRYDRRRCGYSLRGKVSRPCLASDFVQRSGSMARQFRFWLK
jgi:hypothetical protein